MSQGLRFLSILLSPQIEFPGGASQQALRHVRPGDVLSVSGVLELVSYISKETNRFSTFAKVVVDEFQVREEARR